MFSAPSTAATPAATHRAVSSIYSHRGVSPAPPSPSRDFSPMLRNIPCAYPITPSQNTTAAMTADTRRGVRAMSAPKSIVPTSANASSQPPISVKENRNSVRLPA